MTIDTKTDLAAAFAGREVKTEPEAPDVPERIKQHAPQPALRPGGGWKARADAIDRRIRESGDAEKAKADWASRIKTTRKQGMGYAFRRSAKS